MSIETTGPGNVGNSYGTRSVNTPVQMSGAGVLRKLYDGMAGAILNSDGDIVLQDGSVRSLSEAVGVVTLTATGTAFTGACEFRGFVVRAETGGTADVTIYDATSATGTAIMTVENISTGTYYWDGDHATPGVGNGGRRINSTGCHVVISGTCTIDVMVE